MDGSMQDLGPAESGEDRPARERWMLSPRELLTLFTAGWLGGAGLLTALAPSVDLTARFLAIAEALAAACWFIPRLRMGGFGAMLAVLAAAVVRDLAVGERPGSLIFYAAVVGYLAIEERRATPRD